MMGCGLRDRHVATFRSTPEWARVTCDCAEFKIRVALDALTDISKSSSRDAMWMMARAALKLMEDSL